MHMNKKSTPLFNDGIVRMVSLVQERIRGKEFLQSVTRQRDAEMYLLIDSRTA